jgi:hypothetical protein
MGTYGIQEEDTMDETEVFYWGRIEERKRSEMSVFFLNHAIQSTCFESHSPFSFPGLLLYFSNQ